MAGSGAKRFSVALVGLLFLAACENGKPIKLFDKPLFGAKAAGEAHAASAPAADAGTGATVEQDVEAPEIFQKSDEGLWDGRPSLGGVWVAHPDVSDPERVTIVNQDNGRSIIGALFRRERNNPGPRFQVSSDAAAELGMLAGAPARLTVTALRRVQVPIEPAQPAPEAEAGAKAAENGSTTDADENGSTNAANAALAEAATEPEKIESAPIDPVTRLAASAIEEATARSGSNAAKDAAAGGADAAAAAGTAPQARPAAADASASASTLRKPYIQIGIFSVRANADSTASLLRASGVIPTIRPFESRGKSYWRIVVGPVTRKADRTALLKKVAGLGFGDAYPVTR